MKKYELNHEHLANCRVICQVDNKFIFASVEGISKDSVELNCNGHSNGIPSDISSRRTQSDQLFRTHKRSASRNNIGLIAVDQHAAHERILLEILEDEWDSSTRGTQRSTVHKTFLKRAERLTFSRKELFDTTNFSKAKLYEKFLRAKRFGFNLFLVRNQREDEIVVSSVPSIIFQPNLSPFELKTRALELIKIICADDIYLSQLQQVIRKTIHPYLKSRACHSAIRFGDPLRNAEMRQLLNDLSKCRMPFQCAHGRPTSNIIAILDGEDD